MKVKVFVGNKFGSRSLYSYHLDTGGVSILSNGHNAVGKDEIDYLEKVLPPLTDDEKWAIEDTFSIKVLSTGK